MTLYSETYELVRAMDTEELEREARRLGLDPERCEPHELFIRVFARARLAQEVSSWHEPRRQQVA